jgi:quercetin dioxygenase-like cupin family protein
VTTLTFDAIGDATGWHVHEYHYVIVPVTGGTFEVTAPDGGKHELTQQAGAPYLGQAGTEHDVANVGAPSAVFVEIVVPTAQQLPLVSGQAPGVIRDR